MQDIFGFWGHVTMRPMGRLALLAGAGMVVSTVFTFAGGQSDAASRGYGPPLLRQDRQRRPHARAAGGSQMPRTPEGKPDFSGIWQALNTAAWDIQDHNSGLAGYLGVPPGRGVVEGNEIPYKPEALAQKKRTSRNATRRIPPSRSACCRASRAPPTCPTRSRLSRIRRWSASATSSRARSGRSISPGRSRAWLEGWPDFWMGDSRGKWEGDTLAVDVRKLHEDSWFDHAGISTPRRCTSSSATPPSTAITFSTKRPSRTRTCSRGHGR